MKVAKGLSYTVSGVCGKIYGLVWANDAMKWFGETAVFNVACCAFSYVEWILGRSLREPKKKLKMEKRKIFQKRRNQKLQHQ